MTSSPPPPPPRRALGRRSFLRGGLAAGGLGLAAGAAGCGSPLAAGIAGTRLDPGTVTFWNLFGGGDGARLLLMLDEYRRQQGSAESLQAATFAWGNPYYTKVSLATLGDKPPDVAVSHLTRATNLAAAGLLTEITDDVLALGGLSAADFNPKAWQASQHEGRVYAIPMDTHPWVVFSNTDVCERAGLVGPDGALAPITGIEEWEAALTALKEVTGQYGASTATVNDTSNCWRFLQTMYSQREGNTPFLSDEGQEITMNDELVVDTLAVMQGWTRSGLMPTTIEGAGAQTQMFQGQSGLYFNGEWEITTAQSIPDLRFSMSPFPTLFEQPAAQGDSHAFVLPLMERDEEQLRRTVGFVRSMLDQGMTWAEGGHVPTYLPIFQSPEYQALQPQSNYAPVADYAVYDAPAWYSGSGSNFEEIVGAEIGLTLQGSKSPQDAVASMRSQLESYARTANPL